MSHAPSPAPYKLRQYRPLTVLETHGGSSSSSVPASPGKFFFTNTLAAVRLLFLPRNGSVLCNGKPFDGNRHSLHHHSHRPEFQDMIRSADRLPSPREIFSSLDADRDGAVTQEELDDALRKLGHPKKETP